MKVIFHCIIILCVSSLLINHGVQLITVHVVIFKYICMLPRVFYCTPELIIGCRCREPVTVEQKSWACYSVSFLPKCSLLRLSQLAPQESQICGGNFPERKKAAAEIVPNTLYGYCGDPNTLHSNLPYILPALHCLRDDTFDL